MSSSKLTFIPLGLFIGYICMINGQRRLGPEKPRGAPGHVPARMTYLETHPHRKIENMTFEIYANVYQQILMAANMKDKYKESMSYQLGMVAARIQHTFESMLELYRYYADYDTYKLLEPNLTEMMMAYHVIQGQYNKVRLDKKLFRDIQKQHREEEHRMQDRARELGHDGPLPSKDEFEKWQMQQKQEKARGRGRSGTAEMEAGNKKILWVPSPNN